MRPAIPEEPEPETERRAKGTREREKGRRCAGGRLARRRFKLGQGAM